VFQLGGRMVPLLGQRTPRGLEAARRQGAPAFRHAMSRARRCERARSEGSVVPAGEPDLTGGLSVSPIPRAALVTGGARRIGRALVLALAEDGFAVAIHHNRSREAAETLVEAVRKRGGAAVALAADLADEGAVEELLPRAERELGPLGC